MLDKQQIFPLGIGTWGIGGFAQRDPKNNDAKQIGAITYMLKQGMNFFEVSLWSAETYSAKLVAQAIKESGVSRENLFITETIYTHNNPTLDIAKKEPQQFSDIFQTDYVDAIQFNYAAFELYGKEQTFEFLQDQLDSGFAKHVSITNAPLEFLPTMKTAFADKFFAHEVGFNFEIRQNYDLGIIPYAEQNDIKTVIYQPLRRNRTAQREWPLLVSLAKKYQQTQNQIIINWLVNKGYLVLTKSESRQHIDEHLSALNFTLDDQDKLSLDQFRPPNYHKPQIYWGTEKTGTRVDQLSNTFENDCPPS